MSTAHQDLARNSGDIGMQRRPRGNGVLEWSVLKSKGGGTLWSPFCTLTSSLDRIESWMTLYILVGMSSSGEQWCWYLTYLSSVFACWPVNRGTLRDFENARTSLFSLIYNESLSSYEPTEFIQTFSEKVKGALAIFRSLHLYIFSLLFPYSSGETVVSESMYILDSPDLTTKRREPIVISTASPRTGQIRPTWWE